MENKESIYSEVVIDFFNGLKNHWTIDTWKTDDDNEEGVVVATINLKGEINWKDDEAKNDPRVKEEIENFMNYHFFSSKDSVSHFHKEITSLIKGLGKYDTEEFTILTEDGFTTYGIQRHEILGNECISLGIVDTPSYKTFEYCEDDDHKDIVSWLTDDISSAVGEEYVIEFDY